MISGKYEWKHHSNNWMTAFNLLRPAISYEDITFLQINAQVSGG